VIAANVDIGCAAVAVLALLRFTEASINILDDRAKSSASTGVWRNQNSLMLSRKCTEVLPWTSTSDDQIIAEFDAKFQLNEPEQAEGNKFCRNACLLTTLRPDGSLVCLDAPPRRRSLRAAPATRRLRVVRAPPAARQHRRPSLSPTLLLAPGGQPALPQPASTRLCAQRSRPLSVGDHPIHRGVNFGGRVQQARGWITIGCRWCSVSDTAKTTTPMTRLEEVLHGPAQVPRPLPPTP
uniref:START domain-containing protein n=1 Tax=Macrostomum lignano TaxID=282301 RepID=A0A1I8JMV3_9PLAT